MPVNILVTGQPYISQHDSYQCQQNEADLAEFETTQMWEDDSYTEQIEDAVSSEQSEPEVIVNNDAANQSECSDSDENNDTIGADEGSDRSRGSRWKRAQPEKWKRNIAKRLKLDAKKPKSKTCLSCRWKCQEHFSEEDQNQLCTAYNKLESYNRKKDFLLSNMEIQIKQRERVRGGNVNRQRDRTNSVEYYFMKDGLRIRVCKSFFMGTLAIGHSPITEAIAGRSESGHFGGEDKRGRHHAANKTKDSDLALVRQHIESFPKTPSHYTRQHSARQYLDPTLTIQKMHHLYEEYCQSRAEAVRPVSSSVYRKVFCTEYNLSFFKPKKDQCDLCAQYLQADDSRKIEIKAAYDEHIKMKVQCQNAKTADKIEASTKPDLAIATFDLQSVLQIPCSQVSPLYYSRKLNMFNLTVYSLKSPNDAVCYCWTELDGKRGSSEVGTCILKWLSSLPESVNEAILYSDTCSGQNRNRYIAAALLFAVQTMNIKVIHQKFLERGHTYMEVDSMHAAIEFAKKNVPVYSPHDWQNIFRSARRRRPYGVVSLQHSDFVDLKHMCNSLLRESAANKISWMKIKCLKFEQEKPETIQFRYSHEGEYESINVCLRNRVPTYKEVPAYKSRLSISVAKYNDLQKLCTKGVVPTELHSWYAQLPKSNAAVDTTPEPAIEDSNDEAD